MAKKKGKPSWFKLFGHQKALIDSVSDEVVGQALKAVFKYFDDRETEIELDTLAFAVFSVIKPYIDESYEDYERSVESGRIGGKTKQENKEKSTPLSTPKAYLQKRSRREEKQIQIQIIYIR